MRASSDATSSSKLVGTSFVLGLVCLGSGVGFRTVFGVLAPSRS